jgi:hypothetical protein
MGQHERQSGYNMRRRKGEIVMLGYESQAYHSSEDSVLVVS